MLNFSGDHCKIDHSSRLSKIWDTVECFAKYFGHNTTVNIMVSKVKDFIQNCDIIFKFRIITYLAEGFEIIKLSR